MIEKFPFEKIYKFLKKYYIWLLLLIFLILLSLNGFIYYKYIYSVVEVEPKIEVNKVEISKKELEGVLNELEERQETLDRVKSNSYYSPFNP